MRFTLRFVAVVMAAVVMVKGKESETKKAKDSDVVTIQQRSIRHARRCALEYIRHLRYHVTGRHHKGTFFLRERCPRLYRIYKWLEIQPVKGQNLRPRDCAQVLTNLRKRKLRAHDGIYKIFPRGTRGFLVYCDMTTHGGGWTVFQRRKDGSVNFFRKWNDYKNGFGHLRGEFWLGNDKLHQLVAQGKYQLRIDLEDFRGTRKFAKYRAFSVAGSNHKYKLTVGGFSGNAGDSLTHHNGKRFSTKDADNDTYKGNCAALYKGGYWYGKCHTSNLNGLYLRGQTKLYAQGVIWYAWRKYYYSLKTTTMMVKPQ